MLSALENAELVLELRGRDDRSAACAWARRRPVRGDVVGAVDGFSDLGHGADLHCASRPGEYTRLVYDEARFNVPVPAASWPAH